MSELKAGKDAVSNFTHWMERIGGASGGKSVVPVLAAKQEEIDRLSAQLEVAKPLLKKLIEEKRAALIKEGKSSKLVGWEMAECDNALAEINKMEGE